MPINIANSLADCAEITENKLEMIFANAAGEDETLAEAMKYSVLSGGKRIRAFLVLNFAKMFGASVEAALPFACAVEMIHAYSLIHDDLPCMDDSDLRRGVPSCHKKYGEATALLAGDALLTYAFSVCASNAKVTDKSVRLAVDTLSRLASHIGMCGGQAIDLRSSCGSYDELMLLYSLKTSKLIEASCLLGYFAACDEPKQNVLDDIHTYAECVGLAFQIHDDILDVTGDSALLGKPTGIDAKNDKKTIFAFKTLKEAEELETELTVNAVNSVSDYADSDGPCQLAVWLLTRKK